MTLIPYNEKEVWSIKLKNDDTEEVYEGEYIDLRLKMDTIPAGKFGYNCRHDDDGNWITPVTIERGGVMVNFAGVFITDKEIAFPDGKNFIPVTLVD